MEKGPGPGVDPNAPAPRFRKNAGLDDPENPNDSSSSEDEKDERRESRRGRSGPDEEKRGGRNCCKKVLKFLFSHIGLSGMVVAYAVAGGFIFQHLEKTNEKEDCVKSMDRYYTTKNETKYKLWEIAKLLGQDEENIDLALPEFNTVLKNFRKHVMELGYDGKNCTIMGEPGGPAYKWSFPGALMFSVTVITTIGYGNIAPKTMWGRFVCIAYAILGIPLMLLFLANIGDGMADIFRFVYSKICCCGCCRRKEKSKVESIQTPEERNTPDAWKSGYNAQKAGLPPPDSGPIIQDDDEDEEEEEEERISVPLTITLGVVAVYIILGTVMFAVWEKWEVVQSMYFCFVTFSTIGFGDVVPGSADFTDADDTVQMLLCSVYMIFGMAILSMCFSLIQEEIVAKFKWLGEKIGIIEKDGDISKDDSK